MKYDNFFRQGSLLADVLDKISTYGKLVKIAFGFALGTESSSFDGAQPNVLEQTVFLNVNTLSSARHAVSVMMPRLAPMKADLLVWDISGPRVDAEMLSDDRKPYSLGFVKISDLETWHITNHEQDTFIASTQWGGKYKFRSPTSLIIKRKKALSIGLGFFACYTGVLLVLAAWAGRPNEVLNIWQDQIRQVRIETNQAGEDTQNLLEQINRIEHYQKSSQALHLLESLAILSQTLPEGGWISTIRYNHGKIRIHGFTDNPANLATMLEAKPFVKSVGLGSLSSDRASGLQRFILTLTLEEGKS